LRLTSRAIIDFFGHAASEPGSGMVSVYARRARDGLGQKVGEGSVRKAGFAGVGRRPRPWKINRIEKFLPLRLGQALHQLRFDAARLALHCSGRCRLLQRAHGCRQFGGKNPPALIPEAWGPPHSRFPRATPGSSRGVMPRRQRRVVLVSRPRGANDVFWPCCEEACGMAGTAPPLRGGRGGGPPHRRSVDRPGVTRFDPFISALGRSIVAPASSGVRQFRNGGPRDRAHQAGQDCNGARCGVGSERGDVSSRHGDQLAAPPKSWLVVLNDSTALSPSTAGPDCMKTSAALGQGATAHYLINSSRADRHEQGQGRALITARLIEIRLETGRDCCRPLGQRGRPFQRS